MSRSVQIRKPNALEMRKAQQIVEACADSRLCRWAEALLFYGAGLNAQQIAAALAVHVNTIYAYLHGFAQAGLAFSDRIAHRGAPVRISTTQVDVIARIAEQSPTDFGLPYGRWSLAKLQDYLIHQRRVLKAISREHLRRLLKKRTFSCVGSSANSSATTRNALRFWRGFGPFGDGWRVKASCCFSTSSRLASKRMVDGAIARPNGSCSNAIKRRVASSTCLLCMT
jgi:transposase